MAILVLATLISSSAAQMREFKNGFVVLTGPELWPSWGEWAVFPYSMLSPGDSVAGTIRIFKTGSGVPDLALLSASKDSALKSPEFPLPPLHSDDPWLSRQQDDKVEEQRFGNRKSAFVEAAFVPVPRSLINQLSDCQRVPFLLQRAQNNDFVFTLGSKPGPLTELRIVNPDNHSYWGITVSRGGDVEIALE